jgi:AcrR family transcriptional regulator
VARQTTDEQKRGKILERSRALFLEQGISGLSMDRIAARQGISKKTLYRFFPNKDALVSEAIEERIAAVAAQAEAIEADSGRRWIDRLQGILRMVSAQVAELGDSLIRDIYYNRPELWEKIDRFRRERVFSIITRLLEEGRKKGFVRDDIDGRLVPLLFASAAGSVLTPAQLMMLPFPPVEVFDAFIRILFGGILTESARRKLFARERKT